MTVALAVVGAGVIGVRHMDAIAETDGAQLAAVVDPAPQGRDQAERRNVPWHADLGALLAAGRPDGIIVATPNQMHLEHATRCIDAGIPVLVEKPITTDVASARRLVEAGEASGVPILVGHHRRHNPLIAAAKAEIETGAIGEVVAVHGMFWVFKPDDYFAADWRRQAGAGPVFMNLIHDVDLLRHLCGEIVSVQALDSNAVRGNAVEETAAILLRFANGALGTVNVSDTVVAPWSWELTAGENPAYQHTDQACLWIGGTAGSLELPAVRIWRNQGPRSWLEPIVAEPVAIAHADPMVRQIDQFAAVIGGREAPLVSGREGMKTLEVIEAAKHSAATGETVAIG